MAHLVAWTSPAQRPTASHPPQTHLLAPRPLRKGTIGISGERLLAEKTIRKPGKQEVVFMASWFPNNSCRESLHTRMRPAQFIEKPLGFIQGRLVAIRRAVAPGAFVSNSSVFGCRLSIAGLQVEPGEKVVNVRLLQAILAAVGNRQRFLAVSQEAVRGAQANRGKELGKSTRVACDFGVYIRFASFSKRPIRSNVFWWS